METAVKRLYEGMFLVDTALAAQDWQKILDEIKRVLDRAEAEVVSQKKWDERRLCYEVNKKNRGTYILTYFNCDTSKIGGLERDVQLSELITRVLVLRTDRMTPEDLEKATPLEAADAAAKAEEEARAKAKAEAEAAADAKAKAEAETAADAKAAPAEVDAEIPAEEATEAPVADVEVSETPAQEEAEAEQAPAETDDTEEKAS